MDVPMVASTTAKPHDSAGHAADNDQTWDRDEARCAGEDSETSRVVFLACSVQGPHECPAYR